MKSILDIPRKVTPPAPDRWATFDTLAEAVKRLNALTFKGTPITAEHGFTFSLDARGRIVVMRNGTLVGRSKWVWTKNGPQFNVGGWFTYQHYPTY